jgi:hypothetical protein
MSPVMPLCSLRMEDLFMRVGENALNAIRILLQQFSSDYNQIAGYLYRRQLPSRGWLVSQYTGRVIVVSWMSAS